MSSECMRAWRPLAAIKQSNCMKYKMWITIRNLTSLLYSPYKKTNRGSIFIWGSNQRRTRKNGTELSTVAISAEKWRQNNVFSCFSILKRMSRRNKKRRLKSWQPFIMIQIFKRSHSIAFSTKENPWVSPPRRKWRKKWQVRVTPRVGKCQYPRPMPTKLAEGRISLKKPSLWWKEQLLS